MENITSSELVKALALEYPTGVSFAPIAIRLLRQKTPFQDCQIDDLKAEMFQLGNELWFSREMILDDASHLELLESAKNWLIEYGCFSVEQLYDSFRECLSNISTLEDFSTLLRYQGFTIGAWEKGGIFCFQPSSSLNEHLSQFLDKLNQKIRNAEGMLALNEIEEAFPHISPERLEHIRKHVMQGVHAVEIGGVPCWCSADVIPLPEDFPDRLTSVIDTLVELGEKLSISKLEFALNLFCRTRFREEYALQDNDTFLRVCAKHYQGRNDVFTKTMKLRERPANLSVEGQRVRSPNTQFCNLGISVGTELVFKGNNRITCTVLDDTNQVKYNGKAWTISVLANHLLGASSANGFYHFCYEDETLWDRRIRLEKTGIEKEHPIRGIPESYHKERVYSAIIGLEGQLLSPVTWAAFRRDGTNPIVADWDRRFQNGESLEQLAREYGFAVSTLRVMISNFRLYHKVCILNGIIPESRANV